MESNLIRRQESDLIYCSYGRCFVRFGEASEICLESWLRTCLSIKCMHVAPGLALISQEVKAIK